MMTLSQTTRRAALGLLLGVLLAACSTEESLPQLDVDSAPPADETRAGTLLAEYTHPRGEQTSSEVSVHAQFLDVRGVHYETALEALEVWSPDWQLDVDSCSLRSDPLDSNTDSEPSQPGDIRLQLLDVGPIIVRGPGEAIQLEARRLPDLLSAFSGVIYGTEQGFGAQPLGIGYEPGAWYSFEAPGAAESGEFALSMRAPSPIRVAAVDSQPADFGDVFSVDFDEDVAVQWQPSGRQTTGDDVFLHISSGFGPDRPRLTCRLDDDGAFSVPASIVEQLVDGSTGRAGGELQLSLRRINAERIDVDGLETSEFVFSTVDEITLVDREPRSE